MIDFCQFGAGRIGAIHAGTIALHPNARLKVVVDTDRAAAERLAARYSARVASQAEGNRNAGLFWAANRALDADPAADLGLLAAAARQAGLGDREITRTLDSARNGGRTRTLAPDYQAEAGDQA